MSSPREAIQQRLRKGIRPLLWVTAIGGSAVAIQISGEPTLAEFGLLLLVAFAYSTLAYRIGVNIA